MVGATNPVVGGIHLGHFSPLNKLRPDLLEELQAKSRIERLPPGKRLFNKDETDHRVIFLLSGQVALVAENNETKILRADSWESSAPIDDHRPHQVMALARTSISILAVDASLLTSLLERNEAGLQPAAAAPLVVDYDNAQVRRILSTPLFARLPGPHLQILKNRMRQVTVTAGEPVIREGEEGQYYYLITHGRFAVTRRAHRRGRKKILAELHPGLGLGEDALIAGERYDVTVTALEDSQLLRIFKREFLTLVARHYIETVSCQDIPGLQQEGAIAFDIRSPRLYQRYHLPDSINLPLRILRQMASLLDSTHQYIVCADSMRRGASAAFMFARQGMRVKMLGDSLRETLVNEQPDTITPVDGGLLPAGSPDVLPEVTVIQRADAHGLS